VTHSISLPVAFSKGVNSIPTLTEPSSHHVVAPVVRTGYVAPARARRVRFYGGRLLSSFSYAASQGLRLGAEKSLDQIFEDIERHTLQFARETDFGDYALFSIDVDLARTQVWSTTAYTLAETPDSRLPYFPEEDFEG
jgi:hypothetical protein